MSLGVTIPVDTYTFGASRHLSAHGSWDPTLESQERMDGGSQRPAQAAGSLARTGQRQFPALQTICREAGSILEGTCGRCL